MVKLHLGCGPRNYQGWVNIDKYDSAAEVHGDALKLDYKNGTVDEVYLSHVIEHLHPRDFERGLREWYRVLKPGGVLTLRCPYAPVYLEHWLKSSDEERADLKSGVLNCVLGHEAKGVGHYNRNLFTESLLRRYVERAQFTVEMCERVSIRNPETVGRLKRGASDSPLKSEKYPLNDIFCRAVK